MKTFICLLSILLCLEASAQEKAVEISTEPYSITLYTTSAILGYQKTVSLKAGKNTIVFTGLSEFMEDNTVNVSANNNVEIVTVTYRLNYLREKKKDEQQVLALEDSIQRLEKENGLILCRISTCEKEMQLLFKDEAIGGVSKGVAVAEIEKASKFFQDRYYELSATIFNLTEKSQSLKKKISTYINQISTLSETSSHATSEITLIVNSPTQQMVTLDFKYLTRNAGWAPYYDLRYQGPAKPVELIFRANVFNASGISWEDVEIKLSTADPVSGFDTPTLDRMSDNDYSKGNQMNVQKQSFGGNEVSYNQIQVSEFFAEYPVAHKYTIPSDAKPYLVEVSRYSLPAAFDYLLIPKLASYGYLMARIPGWSKVNLISGTTNVYNMGTYMGKTFLNTFTENDTLSVFLGSDNKVQAFREENIDHKPRVFIGNNVVDVTDISISIKNLYDVPVNITMLDQVPYVDNDDKVKMDVNAENAVYDHMEGLLTWRIKMEAGTSVKYDFTYTLKAPKEYKDQLSVKKKKFRTISCPAF